MPSNNWKSRGNKGKGMQIITSSQRRRAKNVDLGAKVLEADFSDKGGLRSGPTGADAFAGADRSARQVAAERAQSLTQSAAEAFGVGKKDGKITARYPDGMANPTKPGNERLIPRQVLGPPRMLEKK